MLDKLRDPAIMGQFRHLLTTIGTAVATYGGIREQYIEVAIGVFIAGLSFYLSVRAPEKRAYKDMNDVSE